MTLTLHLAMRDWDYLTPLLLGQIRHERLDLRVVPVEDLPAKAPAGTAPAYDGAETSLSRYVQARARGESDHFGIPFFPMRAFRHRCILTRQDHPARALSDLRGGRIGVAGWQDSGNTWTRAALEQAGVPITGVRWVLGGLAQGGIDATELARFGQPGWIEPAPEGRPLYDLLAEGALDAVFTPFMPEGFFAPDSPFRPVLDDVPGAEIAWFRQTGFVPGLHTLTIRPDLVARNPWLPQAIVEVLDTARAFWLEKRRRYADTSPWLLDDLLRAGRSLPPAWEASGLTANAPMLAAFVATAQRQGLIAHPIAVADLFPETA